MASVTIIGLGNIGSIFAAHLISSGRHAITCCVRKPIPSIEVEGEYPLLHVSPSVVTNPALGTPCDWILLATKSQDTAGAAPWFRALNSPTTRVVVLQNGIDGEVALCAHFAPHQILPTVVLANGKNSGPGRVRHMSPGGDLILPAGQAGEDFAALFEGTALRVRTSPTFVMDRWKKFLANVVANSLTALTGRCIEVVRGGEMEQLALGLLREAVQVGIAEGVELNASSAEDTLAWMARYPGTTGTSMLQDRFAGRPLEYEILNGAVVRLGNKHDIATPLNRAICALLASVSLPLVPQPAVAQSGE